MSAPFDGSVSSTSVAQRTTFWRPQGGVKGVPPPGNHRGPGALPAPSLSNPSVASFMNKSKSVPEAKAAKRALLEQAAGSLGSAGKGPENSASSFVLAPGALAPSVLGVAGVRSEQGQHVFASESAEREGERADVATSAGPGFLGSPSLSERPSEAGTIA